VTTFPATRPWHEREDWEAEAVRRGLSPHERALVDDYRRDGFVVVEDARVLDEIDADGIWTRHAAGFAADGSGRVQDAWHKDSAVLAIATHPAVLDVLRLLYGREPFPFQTLNFLSGTEQRTHSDTIHFSSLPTGFMCGVWMALEDVTRRQGPLHYFPGSQSLPELDYEDLGVPAVVGRPTWKNPNTGTSYSVYEERIAAVARESGFRLHELAIARGTFLIWSANLLHGGSPRDDRSLTRKSQVTHYYFSGAVPFTPMFSRRSEGRFAVRRVRDVRTGRWVAPSLDGMPVVFPATGDFLHRIHPLGGGIHGALARVAGPYAVLPESPRDALVRTARRIGRKLRW
jgi:ectoine hydroxylase-related dioxygenase (phytanoyl-CoA dioxygenase family)